MLCFLAGSKHLRLLLSFSVGGMLGDVFLHVLPEVWVSSKGMFYLLLLFFIVICWFEFYLFVFKDRHGNWIRDGWWVLAGLLVFIVVEKLFSLSDNEETIEIDNEKMSTDINSFNNNHKNSEKMTKYNNNILFKATNHIQVNYILCCLLNAWNTKIYIFQHFR